MRRLLRWLLWPLVRVATDGEMVSVAYGTIADKHLFIEVKDAFGAKWTVAQTPDEYREQGWRMIGMADDAENQTPGWVHDAH